MNRFFKNLRIIIKLSAIIIIPFWGLTCTISGCSVNSTATVRLEDPALSALDAYINNKDQTFRWEIVSHSTNDNGTDCVVNMISQTWQDIVWKHTMYIIEPVNLTNPEHCVLFITGGSNGEPLRESEVRSAQLIAGLSGMYVTVLGQVPNQPLMGGYTEDGLITETFLKMLETKDESWPLLFPMAKSAVRAMDAVQQLLRMHRSKDVRGFVVFGASKRGWTTWMTAASKDSRVAAIAPLVINTLNMEPQYVYQLANWGYYSEQIEDYSRRRLLHEQTDPNAPAEEKELRERLWHMIDPYFYRERITIPKLLVHGTNDRYWNLDGARFYWNDLTGHKFLLNLPNVGHNLGRERDKALTTIAAFAKLISDGVDLPTMCWHEEYKTDGYTLSVTSDIPATGAKLWTAYNEGRDFREATWNFTELQPLPDGKGNFLAKVYKPESGYVAFYVEIETGYKGISYSLTTEVFHP